MCCFSRPIEHVSSTRIFARMEGARQLLAYEMQFSAKEDMAMVLPIPVVPHPPDDAASFIDLEGYPKLFEDLDRLFPALMSAGIPSAAGPAPQVQSLKVHDVGQFEASFVPQPKDFDRLDPRFRLPPSAFTAQYADYGFAVFKLKPGAGKAHPMAFSFPTRDPSRLFFPTLHIHDGAVHPTAYFDHALYAQCDAASGWLASTMPTSLFVNLARSMNLVADRPVYRTKIFGPRPNQDTWH